MRGTRVVVESNRIERAGCVNRLVYFGNHVGAWNVLVFVQEHTLHYVIRRPNSDGPALCTRTYCAAGSYYQYSLPAVGCCRCRLLNKRVWPYARARVCTSTNLPTYLPTRSTRANKKKNEGETCLVRAASVSARPRAHAPGPWDVGPCAQTACPIREQ
jgi:hypothetical protein